MSSVSSTKQQRSLRQTADADAVVGVVPPDAAPAAASPTPPSGAEWVAVAAAPLDPAGVLTPAPTHLTVQAPICRQAPLQPRHKCVAWTVPANLRPKASGTASEDARDGAAPSMMEARCAKHITD